MRMRKGGYGGGKGGGKKAAASAGRGRGKAGFRHQQTAGGILVEPMHKARTLGVGIIAPQRFQHGVDVLRHAGAALHRKPVRLV